MTTLTLNEHKLLLRLSRDGMLSYDDNAGPVLDHLVELGLVRVFEVFVRDGISFSWVGGSDALNGMESHRVINLTDKGRKATP